MWLAPDAAVPDHGALPGLSAAMCARTPMSSTSCWSSSAMVYGAWENNPVPLTEDALLRPDVEFAFARQLGAANNWSTNGAARFLVAR